MPVLGGGSLSRFRGSPCFLVCSIALVATSWRSSSLSPYHKPRMHLRASAKARKIAKCRYSPRVLYPIPHENIKRTNVQWHGQGGLDYVPGQDSSHAWLRCIPSASQRQFLGCI